MSGISASKSNIQMSRYAFQVIQLPVSINELLCFRFFIHLARAKPSEHDVDIVQHYCPRLERNMLIVL